MKELNKLELEEIEAKQGGLDIAHIKVRGLGSVVVVPPTRGDLTRFQRKARGVKGKDGDLPSALEELARCCVVYPTVPELEAEIEAKRKHGTWLAIGNAAIELSGAGAEEVLGN